MCVEHASAIDDPLTIDTYPASRLLEWKVAQLREYDQLKQGWGLDAAMADEVLQASSAHVAISNSIVQVGGQGGQAPSAGGGGGGAIGRNARGGRGGDGGAQRIDDGDFTGRFAAGDERLDHIDTSGAEFPGAGGGGAGAIGDGAIGGDGGGGGEGVSAIIDMVALREAGFERIEYVVGEAGRGSKMPGQHAEDGGDTIVNFVSKDGAILKSLRAAAGKAPVPRLPDDVAELGTIDIAAGFRVSVLMPVNAAEFRDGLVFVLGGDWATFNVPQFPTDAWWWVICSARWTALSGTSDRGLFLCLVNPAGLEVSTQYLIIPTDELSIQRRSWIQQIGTTFDTGGLWKLRVRSGGFLLAEVPVRVSDAPQP